MAILRFYSKEAWEEAHRLKILKQLKNVSNGTTNG